MELRTRAEQRELDTGRATLRETGRELQKTGNELRIDHIDRNTIDIRKRAAGGAQKTVVGRGTTAESSSPDTAYVIRTLPPDLRKHWDTLTETKKREIIEKAYASANRKDSGEIAAISQQGKNLVRRYGNSQQQIESSNSGRHMDDAGSPTDRKNPEREARTRNNDTTSALKEKPKQTRTEGTGERGINSTSVQEFIRKEIQEETRVPIRQRALRIEQTGNQGNTDRSRQGEDRKPAYQSSGENPDKVLPASGYETRLSGRKARSRSNSYVEEQTREIRNRNDSDLRVRESGIGQRTKGKTEGKANAQAIGKEYGKRETLKKKERVSEENTGLRIVDQEVESGTELRITRTVQESKTGLRTTERNPGRSSELRATGMISGAAAGELRILQGENFQKSLHEGVMEENPHAGFGKDSRAKSTKSGSATGSGNNRTTASASKRNNSFKGVGEKEERGDQRKTREQRSDIKDRNGQRQNTQNRKDAADAAAVKRVSKKRESSERTGQGSSGTGRSRKKKNTPEEASPSQGNRNSAVRLIRRKKKDDGNSNTSRHFVSSFTNLVKADFARAGQIGQEQKRLQVEKSLQEYQDETASRAFRFAVTPLRFAAKKAARTAAKKIAAGIVSATTAAINMLLPMLILLLPVLIIAGILPGLVGAIASEEEEGESYNVNGGSIVEYAREWIGKTKYIYGAGRNGPLDWQDYADCSSFVHGVFSHFGVEIGWTTVEQENSGTKVCENSLSKAEPGDIVLFYDGGSIRSGGSGHVGIYSGSGNMVHNSSSRGTVVEAPVSYQNRPYVVRRITVPFTEDRSGGGGNATKGHRKDPTNYSQSQLELIWAIVAQEDNGSYKGALAVISSAMNRTESSKWSYCGRTAMEQLTAPGQYCYSNDTYWMSRLNGNVPDYVKTAVNDCLKKGIRNHNHTSFRSTKGKVTGPDAVQIGGNWFFDY